MKKVLLKTVLMLMCMSMVLTLYASPLVSAHPYVKWPNAIAPKFGDATQIFSALQAAARGNNDVIRTRFGAEIVYSNVDAYQSIWTPDLWNEVVSADMSQFELGKSKGGEINYGILNGKAIPLDPMLPNLDVVIFTRKSGQKVMIAKWGTNGCLNALCEYLTDEPYRDPDTDPGYKRNQQPPSSGKKDTVVIIEKHVEKEPVDSWEKGYEKYKLGQYDTYLAQMKAMELAQYSKMLQNNNSCGCGSTNTATVTTPMFATTAATAPQPMYYQQPRRFIETLGGQVTANALGTAAGIGIAVGISRLFGGNVSQPVFYGGGVVSGGHVITTGGPVSPQSSLAVPTANVGIVRAPSIGVPTPIVFTATGSGINGFQLNQ